MAKLIGRWWGVIALFLCMGIYAYGYQKMYFHQDDLDWMILVNRSWAQVLLAPIGDHVNYVFRLLFKLEWDVFGFNFPLYLAVSVLIHALVTWLIYLIAKKSSNRVDLASCVALVFVINANWTESVLWVSGQTIAITSLLVLLSIYSMLQKKKEVFWLWLSSWTSALAIGHLLATAIVKKKNRWWVGVIMLMVAIIYLVMGGDGTPVTPSLRWVGDVILVWGLMIINSVIGRLIIPFDRFEMVRIIVVCLLMIFTAWRWKDKLGEVWRDSWSRFLGLQIGFYYLIVAVGRSQYGIGIMRAERYSYLGLAMILLLVVRVLRKWEMGRWIYVIPVIILIQISGFWVRANYYVQRPTQLKKLVEEVRGRDKSEIKIEAYLPHFVLNDERLTYRDLMNLIK